MSKILIVFCRWLVANKYLAENPFPFSNIRKPRAVRPPFITEKDYKLLIADPFMSHQDYCMLSLLWTTAVRREELSLIRSEDFRFNDDGGILHIPPEKSKGGYGERDIPFGPEIARAVRRQMSMTDLFGEGAIFVNSRYHPIRPEEITERVGKIGSHSTGIRGAMKISPKMFRHGRGVVWLLNNIPETIVMRWLGHNSLAMTAHYINMAADYSQILAKKFLPQEYKTA